VRCERGQATIEWVGLVLLASLLLVGAAAAAGPEVDGRSFGGFLTHRFVCAVRGGCDDGDAALAKQYGPSDAELLRRHAPDIVYEPGERELPVDYRQCRDVECAEAPDDRDLDAHRAGRHGRATVFTRVIRRNGQTYLQYWFYYPDSNTSMLGADKLWNIWGAGRAARLALKGTAGYPGFHPDDWETYQVRIDRRGRAAVRSSSHAHYQYCKQRRCRNRWGPSTGWTRVSRGSHAGHIPLEAGERRLPGRHLRERTSTSEGLRLIPLESIDPRRYRAKRNSMNLPWHRDEGVKPPWRKRVYRDPESGES
jgi:hypothetical protein